MPSPFPGMDPFLESPLLWHDLHQRLIIRISEVLQPRLIPRYFARVETRQYVDMSYRHIAPDVSLYSEARVPRVLKEPTVDYVVEMQSAASNSDERDMAVPWIVPAAKAQADDTDDPIEESFIQILLRDTRELVTAIEVISPGNKTPGEGRKKYVGKQREVMSSTANLVEIDLRSEGQRLTPTPLDAAGRPAHYRYIVSVNRAEQREQYEMYPLVLADPLPRFNIPLRKPDADVPLDLQDVFNHCYDNGGYGIEIDYSQPPATGLTPTERAWLTAHLQN